MSIHAAITEQPARRAVIYARVASTVRRDHAAFEQQLDACRAEAQRLGAVVMREFTDLGCSNTTVSGPGLNAARRYITRHPVHYLICHDITRISRHRPFVVTTTQHLREHGTRLAPVQHHHDDACAQEGALS